MKPDQQRIAIAESLGAKWQIIEIENDIAARRLSFNPMPLICECTAVEGVALDKCLDVPDYANDRSAMMIAWDAQPYETRLEAIRELYKILDREYSSAEVEWSDVVADYVQISLALFEAPLVFIVEAYLRTLKLWTLTVLQGIDTEAGLDPAP